MDRHTKIKAAVTIPCMAISALALYAFAFKSHAALFRRLVLMTAAASWVLSGIINLAECFGRRH